MEFLAKLNPEQREAALHRDGPLLILAGAGSGKTRVITFRIAHLIGDGHAEPDQVLAVTFTNKAAQEMRERVEALIGDAAQGVWLSTFHALAHLLRRLVREGDRQYFIGRRVAVADEIRDAVGDDARLARTRAGEDQQRAVGLKYSFLLFRVEGGEEIQLPPILPLRSSPGCAADRRRSRGARRCDTPAAAAEWS